MRPPDFPDVDFDEGNEQELARHHVSMDEVLDLLDNDPLWRPNRQGRAGNLQVIGRTNGGRLLTIIIRWQEGQPLRPITGWDASTGERTVYLRSGKN